MFMRLVKVHTPKMCISCVAIYLCAKVRPSLCLHIEVQDQNFKP